MHSKVVALKFSQCGLLDPRRKQVEPIRIRLMQQYRIQTASACHLCPDTALSIIKIIGTHDRYEFPVRIAMCNRTGVIFLLDRLTQVDYAEFYKNGDYRELLGAFWNWQTSEKIMREHLRSNALKKAEETIEALYGLVKFPNIKLECLILEAALVKYQMHL